MMTPRDIIGEFGQVHEEPDFDGYRYPENKHWLCADGYSCELECGEFLWGLVRYLKPKVIVETGTYFGFATSCMALACRENNLGHIWTIEVREDFATKSWNTINHLGLQAWCDVVTGDSLSDKLINCLGGQPVDLCLIDGGDRVGEYEKYHSLLSPNGILLQHDALKFKDVYLLSQQKGMGFVWGIRGLSMLLPKE